jgi:signal recognition particle receptor subunit beta
MRVFPISNWTELDVWQYIAREKLALPSIYFAHQREVIPRNGLLVPLTPLTPAKEGETVETQTVRFRTVGDISCTCPVSSDAIVGRSDHRRNRRHASDRTRRDPDGRPDLRSLDGKTQEARIFLMNARDQAMTQLTQHSLLRFITAGSVDDGKSTLIGRLLFDSKGIFADQLAAVSRSKHKRTVGDTIDLSLLTDGLEAEREQGITIDVAYRYFATPKRKFIIADTPGHEQYTRNMVTGASTADAVIILVDVSKVKLREDGKVDLLIQTKRHSTIAKLLQIEHVIVAVNKMDLIGYDQAVYDRIVAAYREFADSLGLKDVTAIPLSALAGDNVVDRSDNMDWYTGPTLIELLESLSVYDEAHDAPFRFPVQLVARHNGHEANDFRGYMGRIESGSVSSATSWWYSHRARARPSRRS